VREGDLVKLQIDIPGHGDLTVWGEVVYRAEGRGFGLPSRPSRREGPRDDTRRGRAPRLSRLRGARPASSRSCSRRRNAGGSGRARQEGLRAAPGRAVSSERGCRRTAAS
jgi:hypothetical protein